MTLIQRRNNAVSPVGKRQEEKNSENPAAGVKCRRRRRHRLSKPRQLRLIYDLSTNLLALKLRH